MREAFRFKQFSLSDEGCAMKLGTDSVLLGAWFDPGDARTILDIGSGCGILSLMMAQKSKAKITAVEIHNESVMAASLNFRNSPWKERLKVIESSFQDFADGNSVIYDCIITNPPYFIDSLKAPSNERTLSRHNDSLNHDDLLNGVVKCLGKSGTLGLILPYELEEEFSRKAFIKGLFVQKVLHIRSKPALGIIRTCLVMGRIKTHIQIEEIVIRDAFGQLTSEYQEFTNDFYL